MAAITYFSNIHAVSFLPSSSTTREQNYFRKSFHRPLDSALHDQSLFAKHDAFDLKGGAVARGVFRGVQG